MMIGFRLAMGLCCGLALLHPASLQAQAQPTRTEAVHFAVGTTGATLSGKIKGEEFVTYTLGAEAGQNMTVRLESANTSIYFNLYEPGRGPGDEALATGELTPEINRFSGLLPTSGIYTISVYLYRNAARDGQTASYKLDIGITGKTGDTVEGDFADGLAGGPDFWQVNTTGNGTLKLHESASAGSAERARLPRGKIVRNLGCRMNEGRRWCHVATLADPGVEGWAAGDFLVEGAPPGAGSDASGDALVPGTPFHATGQIECVPDQDAPTGVCDFGVVREGNGNASVTVFWPDGSERIIRFKDGAPATFDALPQDNGAEITVTRENDNNIIFIGPQRFVIPDAAIFGG